MIRAFAALIAGALAWKAIAALFTLAGKLIWPAYAAVEVQRTFTLEMLATRLMVGALATMAFGAVAGWVARSEQRAFFMALAAWMAFSVVDHYVVWVQFPVWYHLLYLAYIVPFAMLGERLIQRTAPS